jgi:hypothetical protein
MNNSFGIPLRLFTKTLKRSLYVLKKPHGSFSPRLFAGTEAPDGAITEKGACGNVSGN